MTGSKISLYRHNRHLEQEAAEKVSSSYESYPSKDTAIVSDVPTWEIYLIQNFLADLQHISQ